MFEIDEWNLDGFSDTKNKNLLIDIYIHYFRP